jgi:hypothetical protein
MQRRLNFVCSLPFPFVPSFSPDEDVFFHLLRDAIVQNNLRRAYL